MDWLKFLHLVPFLIIIVFNLLLAFASSKVNNLISKKRFLISYGLTFFVEIALLSWCATTSPAHYLWLTVIAFMLAVVTFIFAYIKMRIFALTYDCSYVFVPIEKGKLTINQAYHSKGDIAVLGTIQDGIHTYVVWCFDEKVIEEFGQDKVYEVQIYDVFPSWHPIILVDVV